MINQLTDLLDNLPAAENLFAAAEDYFRDTEPNIPRYDGFESHGWRLENLSPDSKLKIVIRTEKLSESKPAEYLVTIFDSKGEVNFTTPSYVRAFKKFEDFNKAMKVYLQVYAYILLKLDSKTQR